MVVEVAGTRKYPQGMTGKYDTFRIENVVVSRNAPLFRRHVSRPSDQCPREVAE
jgi:hypothetical protein